ncbi:TetR family transcriptional regulator [Sinomonas susongensis]|uniref:TetR family transcriptional regulator n=1 Tax=Sinomonas susongensis TaxID=1324851 RepID=UPI001109B006|nr:TetR family transcriptional regulator [Sinomonas susongensis]
MGRWEPNARGRLAQAALALYVEQGFDETTVAQIAGKAGLSERTFFRHFQDKREVLFYGTEHAQELLKKAVAGAPPSATPMSAVGTALEAVGAMLEEDPERVRLRDAVVSSKAELRERELIKLAAFAAAVAEALRERGVREPAASLAAEQGVAIFKVAFTLWVRGRGQSLVEILRQSMRDAKAVIADRSR